MPRPARTTIALRDAVPADIDVLLALYDELDSPQPALLRRGRNGSHARDVEATRAGLVRAVADPGRQLLLALDDGDAVGFALMSLVPSSALIADPAVRLEPLVVARRARRRGVGRALVNAGATFAETHGATVITVAPRPGDRDGNRYFARLGFVPAEVRRVAPVVNVRRALDDHWPAPVVSIEGAARRRRLRARDALGQQHGAL